MNAVNEPQNPWSAMVNGRRTIPGSLLSRIMVHHLVCQARFGDLALHSVHGILPECPTHLVDLLIYSVGRKQAVDVYRFLLSVPDIQCSLGDEVPTHTDGFEPSLEDQ